MSKDGGTLTRECTLVAGDRLMPRPPAREDGGDWTDVFEFKGLARPGYRIRLTYMAYSTDRSGGAPVDHDVLIYFTESTTTQGLRNEVLLADSLTDWVSTNWGQGWIVPSAGGQLWNLVVSSSPGGSIITSLAFAFDYERVQFIGDQGFPG